MSSPPRSSTEAAVEKARRLQQQALAANLTGRPDRGARLATRGLQALGLAPLGPMPVTCSSDQAYVTARLMATLAKSAVEIEGLGPALLLMDRATETANQIADPELQAFLVGQRGLILFRGGRLADARHLLDIAVARIPDAAGIDKWRVLVNRGALFVEAGDVPGARRDLEHAVRLARHGGLGQAERIALHNLGCLEFTAGDLPRALRLMQQGMELDGDTQQGIAHLDRSRVLLAAGLPEEADSALAQAAELFRRDRCWQDLGEVDLTRAEVALLTGRLSDARRLGARARDRFRRHGNDRWRRAAELVLLHADQSTGRPATRLLPHACRLAVEFADAGVVTQHRTAALTAAELELTLGRVEEAEARLQQLGPVRVSDPIAVRLQSRLVRAISLERRGTVPAARRALARGLQDLASYQAQFGGIDLQSASAVHGQRLVEHDLDLALRSGRPAAILAAVERSRAVSARIRPVTPPADDRTAALLVELRQAVDAGSRQTVTELQAELRARSWLNGGSRAWHAPVPVAQLRAAAVEDATHLVMITEVRGRLGAVVVAADGSLRRVELTESDTVREHQRRLSADLDALANAGLPTALSAAVSRSLQHTAIELGRLLGPAFPVDDHPVVISPGSTLLALPWPLLPAFAGRPVVVTPSLSGWHRGRARGRGATAQHRRNGWSATAAAGPGLRRAAQEAAGVVEVWRAAGARTQLLAAATSQDLLASMDTSRAVHVAAHGVHQGENPMFSSLRLTGGPLFAYELDQRERLPEHVVLSACDVGRSTVRSGQETLGLTSVLLQLGSACVVAGVARVLDDTAAEIMHRYHVTLAKGRGAAEALCLVADQVGGPSPFVCFGASWSA